MSLRPLPLTPHTTGKLLAHAQTWLWCEVRGTGIRLVFGPIDMRLDFGPMDIRLHFGPMDIRLDFGPSGISPERGRARTQL